MIVLAVAINYEFHMESMMRFLSNTYITAYMNIPEIMDNIRGIVDRETCDNVKPFLPTVFPLNKKIYNQQILFQQSKGYLSP